MEWCLQNCCLGDSNWARGRVLGERYGHHLAAQIDLLPGDVISMIQVGNVLGLSITSSKAKDLFALLVCQNAKSIVELIAGDNMVTVCYVVQGTLEGGIQLDCIFLMFA